MTDYTKLVTSQHADKPLFAAALAALTVPLSQIAAVNDSMVTLFDIDTVVGEQEDFVGQWVGVRRKRSLPLPNVWFSWDTLGLGWDEAPWYNGEPLEGITLLDDETYRILLKSRVGGNYWNGSVAQLNEIAAHAFAALSADMLVVDNFNMTCTVYVFGATVTSTTLELIKRGLCPPKTAGVQVTGYVRVF